MEECAARPVRLEIDHVVPRGKGGTSTVRTAGSYASRTTWKLRGGAYGDAHMDLFTRNPVAREELAFYGYATKVSTVWSLAVAAALPNPAAGVPMRTTWKFPPTRAA